jgi:hypothetical protein
MGRGGDTRATWPSSQQLHNQRGRHADRVVGLTAAALGHLRPPPATHPCRSRDVRVLLLLLLLLSPEARPRLLLRAGLPARVCATTREARGRRVVGVRATASG